MIPHPLVVPEKFCGQERDVMTALLVCSFLCFGVWRRSSFIVVVVPLKFLSSPLSRSGAGFGGLFLYAVILG